MHAHAAATPLRRIAPRLARQPKALFERVRSTKVLVAAWHEIRRNAETSDTKSTREEARKFGRELPQNLQRLQRRLRNGYHFAPAYGALPAKGAGKVGKRPIVVAPLADRIVQRAILDVLQEATDLPSVRHVLSTPTSIGGIKGRGRDEAILIVQDRVVEGHRYVAGSDIAGFFTRIRVPDVLCFLRQDIDELEFLTLVERALTVELANAHTMSPTDRSLFPTGGDGVAQGCPLSALAGNIVLRRFDEEMNDPARGVTCVRYIDDFIITGASERQVRKAMGSARRRLAALGMDAYDPLTSPNKAFQGKLGEPHVFLGYELVPGEYCPSPASQERLLKKIGSLLRDGRLTIQKVVAERPVSPQDRCFAQTIDAVNHKVRGWRGSFKATQSPKAFEALDRRIERLLADFETFFWSKTAKCSPVIRRRALGVSLLNEDR